MIDSTTTPKGANMILRTIRPFQALFIFCFIYSVSFSLEYGVFNIHNNVLSPVSIANQAETTIDTFDFLIDGSIWIYDKNDSQQAVVTHSVTLDSNGYYRHNYGSISTYYKKTDHGIDCFDNNLVQGSSNLPLTIGKKTDELEVIGYEYITVPAGRFYCEKGLTSDDTQIWMSKQYGVIQFITNDDSKYSLLKLTIPQ